jgi:hypothetical protein
MIIVNTKTQLITNSIKIIEIMVLKTEMKDTIDLRIKSMISNKNKMNSMASNMTKQKLRTTIINTKLEKGKTNFQTIGLMNLKITEVMKNKAIKVNRMHKRINGVRFKLSKIKILLGNLVKLE